jgi:hypothetical protein
VEKQRIPGNSEMRAEVVKVNLKAGNDFESDWLLLSLVS